MTPAAPPRRPTLRASLGLPPGATQAEVEAQINAMLCLNEYMHGIVPTPPQMAFMLAPHPEVLFGGAAGPGKSTGLLLAALMYVHVPGYAALIVRRTFQQLSKPGGLMSKAREWLAPTDARWNDDTRTWTFPKWNTTLTFGHLENAGTGPDDLGDEVNFQGQEYQFIAPDELTQLPHPWPYLYLMTRLRRLKENPVPVRMRPTSNPGGAGHEWVKARWGIGTDLAGQPLPPSPPDRLYIPAFGRDNPHLDWASYLRGLGQLDPVTQAQLIHGNWDVRPSGDLFLTERLRVVDASIVGRLPYGVLGMVRYWDKAGTAGGGAYTAGVLMARVDKNLWGVGFLIVDIQRGQWSPGHRNMIMRQTAGIVRPGEPVLVSPDPPGTVVWIEQEPGSGGKESAEISINDLAGPGVEVHTERATGQKVDRARPFAAQMEGWNVGMVQAAWNGAYVDELRPAPNGIYWDQIDASSGAYNKLALYTLPALPASSPGVRRDLAVPAGLPAGWR
jgi:hypothetical protein